jgi:hypothetical protein
MRTQAEIIARISEVADGDFFGFESTVLKSHLTYENVQQFLKEGHELDPDLWKDVIDDEYIVAEVKDYMEFALEKAYNHRGISANRSVNKMSAWLWLLGDDELLEKFEGAGYAQYGVPQLMVVCEAYDIEVPEYMQPDIANMAQGKSCRLGCDDGCGM